jgi:ADP-heptose:LPS heptosyltransferase
VNRPSVSSPIQSLLVVPPPFIGDAIVNTPLLAQLKTLWPHLTVGHAVASGAHALLSASPHVDRWHLWQASTPRTWQQLSAFHYDAVLLLRTSFRDAWLAKQAGCKLRVGYDRQRYFQSWFGKQGLLLTHCVPCPSPIATQPQAEFLIEAFLPPVAKAMGQALPTTWPQHTEPLNLAFDEEAALASLLKKLPGYLSLSNNQGPVGVVHLAAASKNKGIDGRRLLPTLIELSQQQGFTWVMTGPPTMAAQYEAWWATPLARAGVTWVNMAGHTTLPELATLLGRVRLLVSLDSAPLHMAAAMKTPAIVGIFGATSASQWAPYWPSQHPDPSPFVAEPVTLSLPCRSQCWTKVCSHNQCRADITSHHLHRAVMRALVASQHLAEASLSQALVPC